MSLRDRLAAKQRRRVVVPVDLAPMDEDQAARVATAQAALIAAITSGEADIEPLRQAVEDIQNENRELVGFTACEPNVFEKVVSAYPSPEGEDSGMDWKSALPVVAALCADDEELQDEDWWAEQLGTEDQPGSWSHGERQGLWHTLLSLNTSRPAAHVPKG